jgi:hypothetical protein
MGRDPEEIVYVDNGRGLMEPAEKVRSDDEKRRERSERLFEIAAKLSMAAGGVLLALMYSLQQWLKH